ncbi:IS110 family transposase [Rhizobium leguminosarum bv. trifolii]|uniref:IS110 family transposase n=1 Tax=Rhizobium leguminosarum bv. trifolii TaxID=386 RepID=A0A3E1B7L2_RHILT|nr:IS110 family transposase [Rhizobium leguminosarum]RFB87212.1 IS110 family transposase [Rhizobium leguminosarum bv. trifolii]RFB87393.1 IS110 family transposase [Rhizobium leguminosarum bv. trifolii]
MKEVATIGLDLAKQVFQVHGADAQGNTLFNRKLRRAEVLPFFEKLPPCIVAMEACGGAFYWAREIGALGHEVRILPAQYVKPFVTRGKTDAGDAIAITQAMKRPDIRSVPVKTAVQQAATMTLRTRTFFVRQRANAVNALRGYMAEFGLVADRGIAHFGKLVAALPERGDSRIPPAARLMLDEILAEIETLSARIERIDDRIAAHAKQDEDIRRLTAIPGVGTLTASTIQAHVPDPGCFKSARHFSAWLGLTPKQNSSGEKLRSGSISRMGNAELRSLLYIGAMGVLTAARRWGTGSAWLRRLMNRRPLRVVAVALANKNARVVWALLTKGGSYQAPTELAGN